MIAGSYYGFLLNAAMCGLRREIFSYVSTAGTLQEGSHGGDRMDMWAYLYQKGIAKVSPLVSLCDWRDLGKKGTISQSTQT